MSTNTEKAEASYGEVQDFYERYPYPRPIESLESYREHWQDRERLCADFHLFWPAKPFNEYHSILIAGCGTSQAAKHAVRWPNAKVTGIDFSATSIEATNDLKRRYSLDNLTLRRLPIEQAGELETSFDQIVCTGVLHHLVDPDAGLAALRNVLKPDGAMHLMVYAPYGRNGIYMLQEFCRRIGIRATDDEIQDLIIALKILPPGHPLEKLLRAAPDFQHKAALADALLHPQDRAYSVSQFFDFIKRGKLAFGRWLKQAPYTPLCGVVAKIPQARKIARLPPAEQYAAVELFRGTMVSHSAVVYRNDNPGAEHVNFAGDAWPRYVPMRMSDTVCVEERLPPGATAVLINRTHTFTDLFLAINATEKSMFDAIDGNRCISEIVETVLPSGESTLSLARKFFERLWWYDQVVFTTSRKPGTTGNL